ncbi:MAG: peptidoglycan editing factor PgeF [Chloroflexi bacterium]|nr:peptidoglycan editing factor PgeF [Chloroflexota bacterium]
MERVERSGLAYYRNENWRGLRHGIFTRRGGASRGQWTSLNLGGNIGDDSAAVGENHRRMYDAVKAQGERAATTWLVHGTDVLVVDGPPNGRSWLAKADGMITGQPDIPLVMRFADCVPLLLYDPAKGAIGLGHAGWRGTVKGIAAKMVSAMGNAYGSSPQDIQVVIGPAISQPNYQIGSEVVEAAFKYFGEAAGVVRIDPKDGAAFLDLWLANQLDFQRVGVEDVEVLRLCTYEHSDDFFSHRAEEGKTGRFGVIISL